MYFTLIKITDHGPYKIYLERHQIPDFLKPFVKTSKRIGNRLDNVKFILLAGNKEDIYIELDSDKAGIRVNNENDGTVLILDMPLYLYHRMIQETYIDRFVLVDIIQMTQIDLANIPVQYTGFIKDPIKARQIYDMFGVHDIGPPDPEEGTYLYVHEEDIGGA